MPNTIKITNSVFEHQHRIWPGWSEDQTRLDSVADLVQSLAIDNHHTRVIDLGCGTGQLSNALAIRGFQVIGVDISEVLIAKAKKFSSQMEVSDRVAFIADNYFEYTAPQKQDIAVFWDSSINLFPLVQIKTLLKHWATQLSPAGQFVIEMLNPQSWENGEHEFNISPSNWSPGYTRRVYNFDSKSSILTDNIFFKSTKEGKFNKLPTQRLHLYPPEKFVKVLKEVGVSSVRVLTSTHNNFETANCRDLDLRNDECEGPNLLDPSDKSPSLCFIFSVT